MRELLEFILTNVTGSKDFAIEEASEGEHTTFIVKSPKETMGILIGKEGRTIRAIRNILKVRATLEKKGVSVSIEEKA